MGYKTFVKLSLNENNIIQTESTFNNVSKTELSCYPLDNQYIIFYKNNVNFECKFSEHNVNLLEVLDSSLHNDLLLELQKIENFENIASVDPSQHSQQDLLERLLKKQEEIKEYDFGFEHIFSWVEDREYTRCSSYLTLKTPIITTCYTVFEILSSIRNDLSDLSKIKNSINKMKDSLEREEKKYESCSDENFKKSMLKEYEDKIKSLNESLEKTMASLSFPDVDILLNGVSESTNESFFVKHNLVNILNNLNTKSFIK